MKVRLSMPWISDWVLDVDDAFKVIEMLGKAERYEMKYESQRQSTYHIYPHEDFEPTINVLSEEKYRIAKLAGKPEK